MYIRLVDHTSLIFALMLDLYLFFDQTTDSDQTITSGKMILWFLNSGYRFSLRTQNAVSSKLCFVPGKNGSTQTY